MSSHVNFFEKSINPIPGGVLFDALQPPREIVLAVNPRTSYEEVVGVLQAAKDTENVVILELAITEMNTNVGYTGLTPHTFAERVRQAAEEVGWFGYILHADHVTIGREAKKKTDEEIKYVKNELDARIKAGFTSYAIDASYLFDRKGKNVKEQLKDVIDVGVELFHYIKGKVGDLPFGKEGEVGEIGITEFTTVEEALHYLNELKKNDIELNCIAIANGSKHGVTLDAEGKPVPQLTINLKRTVEIVNATRKAGYRTGVAQHGISGTPFSLIASKFPKGVINKGNVATNLMLNHFEIFEIFEPQLYSKMYQWTIDNYGKEGVPEQQTFVNSSKNALKEYFKELQRLKEDTKRALRAKIYNETLIMMKAFGMERTAKRVYDYIKKKNISY